MRSPEPPFSARWEFTVAPLLSDPELRSLSHTLLSFTAICAFIGVALVGFAMVRTDQTASPTSPDISLSQGR